MKKVIKAHRGMAHVPRSRSQQAPRKGEGSPLRGRRRIGLPQRFRGRSPLGDQIRIREALRKGRGRPGISSQTNQILRPGQTAPMRPPKRVAEQPRQTAPMRPPRPSDAGMGGRPTRIIGRPPRPSDAGMGGRPRLMATPRRQTPPKRQPRPQVTPRPPQAIPRIMNQGGYASRAKYGIVDNLKGK